jgi:hypothetical protein
MTIRCFPGLTVESDVPCWITREVFFQNFDQHDFKFRDSLEIVPAYLTEWFYTPDKGIKRFILPSVQFVAGSTQFINGRHRTAVLLKYFDELPIAFIFRKETQEFMNTLPVRSLDLKQFIELPTLPILEKMP